MTDAHVYNIIVCLRNPQGGEGLKDAKSIVVVSIVEVQVQNVIQEDFQAGVLHAPEVHYALVQFFAQEAVHLVYIQLKHHVGRALDFKVRYQVFPDL